MKFTSRIEIPFFVFLLGISTIFRQFAILPVHASCFINGVFVGLGFLFVIISLLPQTIYEKIPYRKWIDSKMNK